MSLSLNCHACKKELINRLGERLAVYRGVYQPNGTDGLYCVPCAEQLSTRCADCKGYYHNDGMVVVSEKVRICKSCEVTRRLRCDVCGEGPTEDGWLSKGIEGGSYMIRVKDPEPVVTCRRDPCRKKARYCGYCEILRDPAKMQVAPKTALGNSGPAAYCNACFISRGITWCPKCQAVATNGGQRCPSCRPVKAYNYKAERDLPFLGAPDFHVKTCKGGNERIEVKTCKPGCAFNKRYYGIELEVEVPGLAPQTFDHFAAHGAAPTVENLAEGAIDALKGKVIAKRDGSLANGFELVTAPATYDYQKALWEPFFEWAKSTALRAEKTTTCGLHIHVSRAGMSWLQKGKIVQFVHLPGNRAFIEFLSGRPPGHYQDYLRDKVLWKGPPATPVQWVGLNTPGQIPTPIGSRKTYSIRQDSASRYTAVNLQNPHTIEFRLFKATLNKHTFMARLEFVEALVNYAGTGVASIQEMTVEKFCAWLELRRNQYPHLIEHLAKGGYVAHKAPAQQRLAEGALPPPAPKLRPIVALKGTKRKQARQRRNT